jgi:hypothetical protein
MNILRFETSLARERMNEELEPQPLRWDSTTMNKQLWFTSPKFAPAPGEKEKTNPGRFGLALATWIREKFIAQGQAIPEDPIPEDWGWIVMVQRKPFPLWVGCGNEDGNTTRWGLFVKAEPGFFQRGLKQLDPSSSVIALEQQLEGIVKAEPECSDVAWESV